jgi:hypothetical protein
MAAKLGAKRLGQAANIMITISLFTILISFPLSLVLFIGGWLVFAAARVIDGFAEPADATPSTELTR